MGYQTFNVQKAETALFAVQFEGVGEKKEIPIKDLLQCDNFYGKNTFSTAADQIWTFKNGEWQKYMYYVKSSTKNWRKSDAKTVLDDTYTVSAGDSFFFQRSDASDATAATLTLAGGVVPLDTTKAITALKGQTVLLANPWPTPIQINKFDQNYTNPYGKNTFSTAADQVWTFKNGEWQKYMYYVKSSTKNWRESDAKTLVTDDKVIAPGEGFFFQRSDAADATDTTITLKGPDAK